MYCNCLVEVSKIDKMFTYKIPDELKTKIKVGMRVKIPFGSLVLEGFVLEIFDQYDKNYELKDVLSLVDDYPILNKELLSLGKYVKDVTLSTLIKAYQAMLPLALKAKNRVNLKKVYETFYYLIDNNYIGKNDNQVKIIEFLKDKKMISKEKLKDFSFSSLKTLVDKNVIGLKKCEKYRLTMDEEEKINFVLNEEQQKVVDIVGNTNYYKTFLLHGVTGSGKTNVYMEMIANVLKSGKTALVLVPEISLTPQIIKRFKGKFSSLAIFHSGLSDGEKYDEWRKIKEGKTSIVIGARSAIFAPLSNIGIIIIDEEHSSTYKQDNMPRYDAIDIAKKRCEYHNAPLVLGSATPSLESYARASKGVYQLLTLNNRYNNQELPKIKIIDMNQEFKKGNGYISNELLKQIQKRIDNNEQTIIFLNRRGYSNTITCRECGNVEKCPNCDITLTYHKTSNMLRCHYCGYAKTKTNNCPKCNKEYTSYGIGTEKIEEELNKLLKNAKTIRMDIDTTTTKNAHEKIITAFANKEYNILLGTQMISKGLDFPNCTLVGVINADISLNFPDFRASEVTFELLNQVSGRSGRGDKKGLVLIQTFNPEHYAIKYTINNDYKGFFLEEMRIRKKLGYPPYYYLVSIKIISKDYNIASDDSINIGKYLKAKTKNCIILGPSVANPFKINNNYRFQIIIKYKDIKDCLMPLKEVNEHYLNKKDVKIEIDFNPRKL